MKIEIDSCDNTIYCEGVFCNPGAAANSPCVDCPLNDIFRQMFAACNPENCKSMCLTCEYKKECEKSQVQNLVKIETMF